MVKFIKRDLSNKRQYPSQDIIISIFNKEEFISIEHKWEFLDFSVERSTNTSIKLITKFIEEKVTNEDLEFQEYCFKYLTNKIFLNRNEENMPISNNMEDYYIFLDEIKPESNFLDSIE